MKPSVVCIFLTAVLCLFTGCIPSSDPAVWQPMVKREVNQLGYRNWIVVAEASFPVHNKSGLRQITTEAEVPEVVDFVINCLEEKQHVQPRIYLSREMGSVENDFAPGMDELRTAINRVLHSYEPTEMEQESIITVMESTQKKFNVLLIRTNTALPYSSVFFELEPGYWDAESEARLRSRMQKLQKENSAPSSQQPQS